MRVYVGQTRSRSLVPRLQEWGFGEMTVRGELPSYRAPYAFDNGVFRDWTAGKPWDVKGRWQQDITWLESNLLHGGLDDEEQTGALLWPPDFIVCPDVVAGGLASLKLSSEWAYHLRCLDWDRLALVVQNGMEPEDIDPVRELFTHVFVGGDAEWKEARGRDWVEYAHANGMLCHIGRVGTARKVRWALSIGADSIDSCLPLWSEKQLQRFLAALGMGPQLSLF